MTFLPAAKKPFTMELKFFCSMSLDILENNIYSKYLYSSEMLQKPVLVIFTYH